MSAISNDISDDTLAEAAAWIAKLHGPDRDARLETGFRRWLLENPAHQAAFDRANELWLGTERLPKAQIPLRSLLQAEANQVWPKLLAAAGLAVVAIGAGLYLLRDPAIETSLGEQRTIALEDGTRVALNTATRIQVHYDSGRRRVELSRGEALFEVAKDKARPFVVTAGDRQIAALGTKFVVRQDEGRVSVTLLEGLVAVDSVKLSVGQRLTIASNGAPKVDSPELSRVTDWQRGQVRFDGDTLESAIAEMNRYSVMQLALDGATRGRNIKVTGIFRAGDSLDFANAVALNYGVVMVRHRDNNRDRITLSTAEGSAATP